MKSLFEVNGLMFWNENEIRFREYVRDYFARKVQDSLISINKAWKFVYFEGPILTPQDYINSNYTEEDVFFADEKLILRPETTPSSYVYAKHILCSHDENNHKMPLCVWQAGKSFRKEQDKTIKNMRLKEFYQQEFQCIFSKTTKCDYYDFIINFVKNMIKDILPTEIRVVLSDRLPNYSEITTDIEVYNGDKWMEICSISKRNDFEDANIIEIAIGLDRIVYNSRVMCS